ncbi:hypothetical protein P5673_020170 [Acropora cervicornis]|uniref:Uncharacterized protein n=1 Tax=Acropora cervicornis TaxID=6130 RepID=A0AAD9Q9Y4_ACRCE|nr:hypothetical protein P5673_020170 [Acropora cervicornis]
MQKFCILFNALKRPNIYCIHSRCRNSARGNAFIATLISGRKAILTGTSSDKNVEKTKRTVNSSQLLYYTLTNINPESIQWASDSNYVCRQDKKPQVTEGSANVTNRVPATGLCNKTLGE